MDANFNETLFFVICKQPLLTLGQFSYSTKDLLLREGFCSNCCERIGFVLVTPTRDSLFGLAPLFRNCRSTCHDQARIYFTRERRAAAPCRSRLAGAGRAAAGAAGAGPENRACVSGLWAVSAGPLDRVGLRRDPAAPVVGRDPGGQGRGGYGNDGPRCSVRRRLHTSAAAGPRQVSTDGGRRAPSAERRR